jgi:hypothetical protein
MNLILNSGLVDCRVDLIGQADEIDKRNNTGDLAYLDKVRRDRRSVPDQSWHFARWTTKS